MTDRIFFIFCIIIPFITNNTLKKLYTNREELMMASKSLKSTRQQMTFFFYCSLLLAIFFLIQIRYTLNIQFANWSVSQYVLIFLLFSFIIICCLKYYAYNRDLKVDRQLIDLEEKKLHLKKMAIREQVASMNPYDFGELVADLFRMKGFKRIFLTPRMNKHFYDLEMYLDDKKVLVSCLLNALDYPIPQSYLDRLHLMMRNNQIDQGVFVTLGHFSEDCYQFSADKPIYLINGDELIETLIDSSEI